jgi:carbamoyl-phosphate synthase small subunit
MDRRTNRVEITAHNHGFAVDVPTDTDSVAPFDDGRYGRVRVSHIALNDGVVEGLECLDRPAFSVQYHPEAAAGPHDAGYLFDRFVELCTVGRPPGRAAQPVGGAQPTTSADTPSKESDAPPQ